MLMPLGKLSFLHILFLENEQQTTEKTSEQLFLDKTKPTYQNLAICEHFQNGQNSRGVLAPRLSIVKMLIENACKIVQCRFIAGKL